MPRAGPDPKSRNTYSLATVRLDILVPEQTDADGLYSLIGGGDRREVCANLIWDGPDSIVDILSWIERCQSEPYRDHGFHFVIRDRSGDISGTERSAIGAIGTRPRDEPGRADVGYWLAKPYWGQGIMSEALEAVLDLGFTELDYYRMEAEVFTQNTRGRRLVERAGMTQEGTVRHAYRKYGEWVDAAMYAVLYEEWSPPR